MTTYSENDDARDERDLARLVVPAAGYLDETGDPFDPYRVIDPAGQPVGCVSEFLRDLQAAGRAAGTLRSYGTDLLRWFRFAWAAGFEWDQATRAEARDFCRWMQVADKPQRDHWRTGQPAAPGRTAPGTVNAVTGKASPGRGFAVATVAHCETVCRFFYDFHLSTGAGPLANPFPLARSSGRPNAHHNPMEPFLLERTGLYRPKLPRRIPRQIPDGLFDELFASLRSHRDRALLALWISTGARASELLGVTCGCVDPGNQLVTVIRKGSRAMQAVPASPDSFVWLRLWQAQMQGLVPSGPDDPVWWTLRKPYRPLTYHAARAMLLRADESLGANWSLHDLRHSAAYRMSRDPEMRITDIQAILGHARLSSTQIYTTPTDEDVIAGAVAHHARRAERRAAPPPLPAPGYLPETLDMLFGTNR